MEWNGENYIREMNRKVGERVQAAAFHLVTRIRENISVAGTRVAASGFTGRGVSYERANVGEERLEIIPNAFGVKGKRYRKGRRIYGANPSKPGEFPHKQFGVLRRSIAQDYAPETVTARVGTPLSYGKYLELGSKKMAARPYLRRTLAEEQQKIEEIILGSVGGAGKPASA